jgi:hypothetical protein
MAAGNGSATPSSGADRNGQPEPELFTLAETHDNGGHHLRVYSPTDPHGWLEAVAREYRALRTSSQVKPSALEMDGIEIVSLAAVERILVESVIPKPRGGNFDVLRSDLGEMVLGLLCETHYGSRYGYRSIRDRETIQLPGRGIDQIGVELAQEVDREGRTRTMITLVLGEAKVSSDKRHPPGVVDTGADCLRAQHLGHLADRDGTANKIWRASQACGDAETVKILRIAAQNFRHKVTDRFQIVCASVMLRPERIATAADFGSFRSNPDDYTPGQIRFLLVKVPHADFDAAARELARLAGIPASDAGGPP